MSSRFLSPLLALAAAALCAYSQTGQPTFTTTTRLVEFSVVALDKKGAPVTDLSKDDLEVLDKGKPRDIAFFRFEGGQSPTRSVAPLPVGVFTNRSEYNPGPPRNITAIVLDTLNTPPGDQMWVRAMVVRYLRALPPDTRVALYHLGKKMSVLHDFTDDPESLRKHLEHSGIELSPRVVADIEATVRDAEEFLKMFDEKTADEVAKMLAVQIEAEGVYNDMVRQDLAARTLGSLEALGRQLSGIPGRKSVVWIGGGISMLSVTGQMGMGPRGGVRSFETQVRSTSQRLAQQGVALYVVDARGVQTIRDMGAEISGSGPNPVRGRGRFERQQQTEQLSGDTQAAMNVMAAITGGRVLINSNDPSVGIALAAADVRAAYSIGFYVPDEPDGRWHNLKVRSKRKGISLRYRQGFLAETAPATARKWDPDQWRTAIFNPLGSTAIHLDAKCVQVQGAEPGMIFVALQIEPNDLHFRRTGNQLHAEIEIGFAEKTAQGAGAFVSEEGVIDLTEEQLLKGHPESFRFQRNWKATPGVSSIRLVVRDKVSDQFGTLEVPFNKVMAATAVPPATN